MIAKNCYKNKHINGLDLILILLIVSTLSVFLLQLVLWLGFHNNLYISISNSLYLFTKKQIFPVWLLNALFLIGIQLLIMLICRRLYVSEIIYFCLLGLLILGEYFKINNRNEPILPGDLYSFKSIIDSIKFLPKMFIIIIPVIVILIMILCISIYKFDIIIFNKRITNLYFLILVLLIGIIFVERPQENINQIYNYLGDNIRYKFDATLDYSTDGMCVSFANNLIGDEFEGNKYVLKNYNHQRINQIVSQYKKLAKQINKSRVNNSFKGQTVIYVLSESYTRPVNVPNLKLDHNPTPNMDNILKNNTSGHMISAGYGGGTANMEYMADTSFSTSFFAPQVLTPFIQVIPKQKQVTSFATDYFNNKIAIHPFLPNYYNRPDVFNAMHFNYFYNIKSQRKLVDLYKIQNDEYYSDASAYQNTLDKISHSKDESQYIELITMQNHMPYYTNEYQHQYKILAPLNQKSVNILAQESYLEGLSYTDQSTLEFLNKINQIKRPISIVFYGDHWPSCFTFMNPNQEPFKTHLTDYFIYENQAAKNINGDHKVGKTRYVSPTDFTSMLLQKDNMKVTPFYALMTKVHQELPAICNYNLDNRNIIFVKDLPNNKYEIISQKDLTKQQLQLLHNYQLIQYDICCGKQYSIKDGMFNK